MSQKKRGWRYFFETLKNLFCRGFKKPAPTLYFVSVIFIAGGVGFWYPLISTGKPDLNSAMTYIFALLAAVIADFFTSRRNNDFYPKWEEIEKDFTLLIISSMIIIASTAAASIVIGEGLWAWFLMAISSFLIWFLWWILLEPQKFDLDLGMEGIERSTIGDLQPSPGNPSISLDELRRNRSQGGNPNE